MKKILVSLLVLALCAPAMAATITVVDNETTPPSVTVTVATEGEEANIVGVALDVDLDQGTVTAAAVGNAAFNIYPDAAYTEELGDGYAYGEGTPIAAQATAGEVSLPLGSFCLSFANLNGETTAGADGAASVSVVLTLDDPNEVLVCENAERGGIVAVDGTALVAPCGSVIVPPADDICKGNLNDDTVLDAIDASILIAYITPYAPTYTVDPIPAGDEKYNLNGDTVIDAIDVANLIAHLTPYAPTYTTTECMP